MSESLQQFVDLRSDTVTKPTLEMRRVMMEAEVGDDVYGEDPTVNALEERAAKITGKESAIFVVSGTMANELAIKIQTEPGDEVLMHESAHPFHHEAGAPAVISGVTIRPLPGERGIIDPDAFRVSLRPQARHMTRQRLLCIENTHNHGGGTVIPLENIIRLETIAREAGLSIHMDGARIFNASIATQIPVDEYAKHVDTISFCLSKGLGAPIGSLLCGPSHLISKARRFRHMMGGGWRQAGILAKAGLYALDHHVERLKEDHKRAKILAQTIEESGVAKVIALVETNIILFSPSSDPEAVERLRHRLMTREILVSKIKPHILRAVLHLDIDDEKLEKARKGFLEERV